MKNESLTVGQNPLPLLRYDGKLEIFPGRTEHQFTEYDTNQMSYGASFYVPTVDFSVDKLIAKRASKAEEFSRCALL